MNLKIFASLLLFAGFSLTSGNSFCFQVMVPECFAGIKSSGTPTLEDYCNSLDDIAGCLIAALGHCEVENHEDVDGVLAAAHELCKPGTELNKKLTRRKFCLASVFPSKMSTCMVEVHMILENLLLTQNQESISQPVEALCGNFHEAVACIYNIAEEYCTKDGSDILSALVDPVLKRVKNDCDAVPEDVISSGASTMSPFSWVA